MRFKHNKHSRTVRQIDRNKGNFHYEEYGVVKNAINNPELDKHRTAFFRKTWVETMERLL